MKASKLLRGKLTTLYDWKIQFDFKASLGAFNLDYRVKQSKHTAKKVVAG